MPIITNNQRQPCLRFVNTQSNKIQNDIWHELQNDLWKQIILKNYFDNDQTSDLDRKQFKPIFPNIIPLYPGFNWNSTTRKLDEQYFHPAIQGVNLKIFLEQTEEYFDKIKDKKIGVHLSGGLDSSIIIGLLKYFKIPAVLIGIANNRYEFRTERYIQNVLSNNVYGEAILFDVEQVMPYGDLNRLPPHQIPTDYIAGFAQGKILAETFKKKGVEIVFTGMGGDNLFQDPIKKKNFFWQPNEFRFHWQEDMLYSPNNISLISFYAQPYVMNAIYNMRLGQDEDIPKIWARKFFKDFLPTELVNYSYYGDSMGTSISGIKRSKPIIKQLFEEAYDLLKSDYFSTYSTDILLKNMDSYDMKNYIALASRISVATWLHSLFKNQ